MKRLIILWIFISTSNSCSGNDPEIRRNEGWSLKAMTVAGANVPLVTKTSEGYPIEITVEVGQSKISGNGSVNGYDGKAKIGKNGTFQVTQIMSTEMGGPMAAMKQEETYFKMLGKMTRYEIIKGDLILSDGTAKNQLHYKPWIPPAPKPLLGTRWIYQGTEEGTLYVLAAGPEYRELAVHEFGAPLMATPAISEGSLFVRTPDELIALGERSGAR